MMPESTVACGEEHDAAVQTKLDMLRGSAGPSVLSRRLNRKVIDETEGTSTTDTDGTETGSHESDAEDTSDEALDFDEAPDDEDAVLYRSPDPFDYMPSLRCRPAFSENEVCETRPAEWMYSAPAPAMQPMAQPEVQPMQMPQMQMQPMQMPPMGMQPMAATAAPQMGVQAMQPMCQSTASCSSNTSLGRIVVPVPVPVPFQMPFSMPKLAPRSVPVPPGFKLVRIPETTSEKTAEKTTEKTVTSAISNPANTERKIFVGGLNPSTTGQTLREYFATFGAVTDAKVIRDGEKSKGFGFVQFKDSIPAEVLERTHIIDQRRCGVGPAFHDGAR